jgi:hypothetical protein
LPRTATIHHDSDSYAVSTTWDKLITGLREQGLWLRTLKSDLNNARLQKTNWPLYVPHVERIDTDERDWVVGVLCLEIPSVTVQKVVRMIQYIGREERVLPR